MGLPQEIYHSPEHRGQPFESMDQLDQWSNILTQDQKLSLHPDLQSEIQVALNLIGQAKSNGNKLSEKEKESVQVLINNIMLGSSSLGNLDKKAA